MISQPNKSAVSAEEFWEGIYRNASPRSGNKPGKLLEQLVKDLSPGRALEYGCAKGDDAIWLAKRGWCVTAVDVSSTVLGYAAENADSAGVCDQISFEQHDLSKTAPEGEFDLFLASFFYSPTSMKRAEIFRRAANKVVSGGHLLIIDHGSRAPWSWASPDTQYPTAHEAFKNLGLEETSWQQKCVSEIERTATGPEGQKAKVTDILIYLCRM